MKWFSAVSLMTALSVSLVAAPKRMPLAPRYAKWLNEDVVYIVTDQEKKTFLGLATDSERDKFEEDFWSIRNPGAGPENPYKTEHYSRIEYANSHFGKEANTPGWMTDMGRTWILFGKPTSQHPFVGYSQIYPLELWFYDNPTHSPSLPSFFYVMFYIPGDIGVYKFYRPFLDGPMHLVRGSQFNSNSDVYKFLLPLGGDLAHAAFSLVAGDPIDKQTFQPDMSSDMLISKIQNYANDHFNLEQLRTQRSMRALVTTRLLVAGKDLNISTVVLTDAGLEKWLDYCFPVDDEKMGVRTDDGQFAVDVHYRLTNASGTLILEDDIQRKYPAYAHSSFAPFEIAGRIPVVAGKYKLEANIVNRKTGVSYQEQTAFTVPANAQETWLSGPLLADSVSNVAQPGAAVPYQYFGVQFHPLFRNEFPATTKMRVLYQVYEPQPVDYDVEYILANVLLREARVIVTEHVAAAEFHNHLLLKSKTLDTSTLPAGEYILALQLKSAQGPVISSLNQRLHIMEGVRNADLYFLTDPQSLETPGLVDYMRGLSAIAQDQDAAAQNYFERSLKRNPANNFGKQFLVRAYYHQHKYQAISDLYRRGSLKDFNVSPDVLAEIAVSLWDSGDPTAGRSVLQSARGLYPDDSFLAAADKLFSATRN